VFRRTWLRFTLEALFLLLVAVAAGLLDLSIPAIFGVMLLAYVGTVVLEWTVSRAGRRAEPAAAGEGVTVAAAPVSVPVAVVEPGPVVVPEPGPVRVPEPEPPAMPEPEPERMPEPEPPLIPEPEPDPVPEPEPDVVPEPEAEPEPELEPVPAAEAETEPEPEPLAVPEPAPVPAPQLVAVPTPPQPDPEPVREPEPELEPEPEVAAVATLPVPVRPKEWNVWELERLARERAGDDPARDEEWSYLLVYLRDYAAPDGLLPLDFDQLVRESFGELVGSR
jgi:hypothetical protein